MSIDVYRLRLGMKSAARDQGSAAPARQERLDTPARLYAKVQDREFLPPPHTLAQDSDRDRSVARLIDLRNELVHFTPKGLSLELGGMPAIVAHVLSAIEHLAVSQPSYLRHLNDFRLSRMREAIVSIRQSFGSWAARVGVVSGFRLNHVCESPRHWRGLDLTRLCAIFEDRTAAAAAVIGLDMRGFKLGICGA